MEKLGVWLRQTREAQGSTLKDVEEATHIRARFVKMLETGQFSALPGGEVQARGFLRLYARYLDLPPNEVLSRYQAELDSAAEGAKLARRPAPAGAQRQGPPPPPSPARTRLLLIGTIVLVVLAMAAAATALLLNADGGGQEATATPPATATLASVQSPLQTPAPPAAATPTFAPDPEGEVTLTLEATEHVWVSVSVDGVVAFEGILAPGQTESWTGQEIVAADAGNGAGLLASVNGQPQGRLGGRGEVSTRAWSPDGEVSAPSP